MSYFKNEVHLLFLQIPFTGWEPVHDYLITEYESPQQLEGTYQNIVENYEIDKDHLVLYVVCSPYERMIRSLFSLGKINTNSTKEEVFHALQFSPTQFSYVSLNQKLVPSKIIHVETLNEDMNTIGYECSISVNSIPFNNYLNDKSIHAINQFYEKDFEMFQYEKRIPTPKRHYSQISIKDSYYPSQYASLYGWNTYVKTDAVIFVCSFGGSLHQATCTSVGTNVVQVNTSDVHTYWSKQGISASLLYMYTSPDADIKSDSFENNMDCSIIGSLCGCTIVLCVFSPYDTFTTAFQFMLAGVTVSNQLLKPTHISISWGCPESIMDSIDKKLHLTLKNSKVTICAAAGNYDENEPTCNFPASCPYIISVGGTSIQSLNPFSEITWNMDTSVSKVFDRPYYQRYTGMRSAPDIYSISDPNTGIYLYYNGQLNPGNGGTSIASPFVTAMFAITGFQCKQKNQLSTYPNVIPLLYSLSCFNRTKDFESVGSTGLGSIQWDTFSNNINKIFTPPIIPSLLAPPAPSAPPSPSAPSAPPPVINIPTHIILTKPFKITLPLYAVYFIQNPTIAYLSNNIIYPRKKGTTHLFIQLFGKWYICDIKV